MPLAHKGNKMKSSSFNAATGTSSEGFSKGSNKYMTNHHSGKMNDGSLINKGRGPTGGGTSVPAGKEITMGCHNSQVRQPSGTKEMPNRGKETFNFGRGPMKGNA
jgi:hypothetical protein